MLKQDRCPNCNSPSLHEHGGKIVCDYCRSAFSVARYSFLDEEIQAKYNRAIEYRVEMRFDDAIRVLDTLIRKIPDCAELYYQALLARLGVSFVDEAGQNKVTISRLASDSIYDLKEAKLALKYADPAFKGEYEEVFNRLEEIRSRYIALGKNVEPYDVFLSFKQHPDDKKNSYTQDYAIAREIYDDLTKKGVKVFFSPVSLMAGTDYEPYIYHALQTSKVMLLIAASPDEDFLESPWVKNEWARFDALAALSGGKKVLIPVLANGYRPDYLPGVLATKQAIFYDGSFWARLTPVLKEHHILVEKQSAAAAGGLSKKKKVLIIVGASVAVAAVAVGVAVPVAVLAGGNKSSPTIVYNNGSLASGSYPIESITFYPVGDGVCLSVGRSYSLNASRSPSYATEKMNFRCGNDSLVTYASGVITGAKGGMTKAWLVSDSGKVKSNEIDLFIYELQYDKTYSGLENNNSYDNTIERCDITDASLYFEQRSKSSSSKMYLNYEVTFKKTYQDSSSSQKKMGIQFQVCDASDNLIGNCDVVKTSAFESGQTQTLRGSISVPNTTTLDGGIYKINYRGVRWTDIY